MHRSQITFDGLDQETGEVDRGRIPASPAAIIEWVGRFGAREVRAAVEGRTGWYFVCQALESAGARPRWPRWPRPGRGGGQNRQRFSL